MPGVFTKKSKRISSFRVSMCARRNPPPPRLVREDSATTDANPAETAASKALPPRESISIAALAVSGWPDATAPFIKKSTLALF